jgi:aspartate ammonia-lyase
MKKYYGRETKKALHNFTATGRPFSLRLAHAILLVKKCATQANIKTKKLDKKIGGAILKAVEEGLDGTYDTQFVVDETQGGGGTSMHMNVNEVIAARASEILQKPQSVHPNDHVNMSQSTNDVVATAIRITTAQMLDDLIDAYRLYHAAFDEKAQEFKDILKVGRTHLQDALPMTLGQEFGAHASALSKDIQRLTHAQKAVFEINLGGTAIGTGLNASRAYADYALDQLKKETHYPLRRAKDLIYATQYTDSLVEVSATLSVLATNIVKCMHDLRILASGPRTGFGEISFKKTQAGSSIMPGKNNPVMFEYLNQIALQVIGNNNTVALVAQAGQLELNVMTPLMARNIFESLEWLTDGVMQFTERGLKNIRANKKRCAEHFEASFAFLTALAPEIGYDKATQLAEKAHRTHMRLKDVLIEERVLTEAEYEKRISSQKLIKLT